MLVIGFLSRSTDRSRAAARARLRETRAQPGQERFTAVLQLFLQLRRAIAIAAGPRLGAIFMAAIAARVRVLHHEKLEIFLPIRALFFERRSAEARLHPRG